MERPRPPRRQAPRRRAAFHVDITRINALTFQRKWDREVGVDIGLRGLRLSSTQPLPAKANLTVVVLLPAEDAEAYLELDAKLIWARAHPSPHQAHYLMGLEFTRLDREAQQAIERFVHAAG